MGIKNSISVTLEELKAAEKAGDTEKVELKKYILRSVWNYDADRSKNQEKNSSILILAMSRGKILERCLENEDEQLWKILTVDFPGCRRFFLAVDKATFDESPKQEKISRSIRFIHPDIERVKLQFSGKKIILSDNVRRMIETEKIGKNPAEEKLAEKIREEKSFLREFERVTFDSIFWQMWNNNEFAPELVEEIKKNNKRAIRIAREKVERKVRSLEEKAAYGRGVDFESALRVEGAWNVHNSRMFRKWASNSGKEISLDEI